MFIGDIEWIIVDFDHPWSFADGQEHHSITLWSRYTLGSVQFDAPENQYAITEDTIFMQQNYLKYTQGSNTWYFILQDPSSTGNDRIWLSNNGTYKLYYKTNAWTIMQVSNKSIISYQTTLTQDPWDSAGVWSNSCTFTLWKKYYTLIDDEYIEATVQNHATVTADTYYEHNPDGLFGSNYRKSLGYNRWSQSGIRQWMNSDKKGGTYYVKQNIFDNPSDQMSTNGFIYGFNQPEFLNNVASVTREVAKNQICDCGGFDTVTDKFFLPTTTQLGNTDSLGGSKLAYFQTDGQTKRIKYSYTAKTSAQYYWTGSPNVGTACYVWYVYPAGGFNNNYAYYSLGSSPACVII